MTTKKLFSLGLLLVVAILFTTCGNANSPMGITRELANHFNRGDFEAYSRRILELAQSEFTPEERESFIQDGAGRLARQVERDGGAIKTIGEVERCNANNIVHIQTFRRSGNGRVDEQWLSFYKTDVGWKFAPIRYRRGR